MATEPMEKSKHPVRRSFVVSLVIAVALAIIAAIVINMSRAGLLDVGVSQVISIESAAERLERSEPGGGYRAVIDELEQLEAAPGQYWALTSGGVLLFVEDEANSNYYRGLPADTHPVIAAASGLLSSGGNGSVQSTLSLDGVDYRVRAMGLQYDGADYQLYQITDLALGSTLGSDLLDLDGWTPYALAALALVLIVAIPTIITALRVRKSRTSKHDSESSPGQESASLPKTASSEQETMPVPDSAFAPGCFEEPLVADSSSDVTVVEPRPADALRGYLESFLAAGIPGGCMVRVSYENPDARASVLRRLGSFGDDLHECFDFDDLSLVLVMTGSDFDELRGRVANDLLPYGDIVALVALD